jgi:hypothetical protein
MLIVGTHEKLHAEPISKISGLPHLCYIATPTERRFHPGGKLASFIFLGLLPSSEQGKLIARWEEG